MVSSFRSRGLLILMVLAATVVAPACGSVDRSTQEQQLTEHFDGLLPGGRVLSNDMARDKDVHLIGAWLFEDAILVEDVTGKILSVDRNNLAPKWFFERLPKTLDHPPGASPVSFLFISDGNLYEVQRSYGNLMRGGIPLHFIPSGACTGSESSAYIPALAAPEGKATLFTVNLATGIEGWRIATRTR
jgi:hypothetical protein